MQRTSFWISFLVLLVLFLCWMPVAHAHDAGADARHLRQFRGWVLGGKPVRRPLATKRLSYRMMADADVQRLRLLPEFDALLAEVSRISGVAIVRAQDEAEGADPDIQFVDVAALTASNLRAGHSDELRWLVGSRTEIRPYLDMAIDGADKIYRARLSKPPEHRVSCVGFTVHGEREASGTRRVRRLVFLAPRLIVDLPDAERRKTACYVESMLVLLGVRSAEQILDAQLLVVGDDARLHLGPDVRCILEVLYDSRMKLGLTPDASQALAHEIIPTKKACNGSD